MPPRKKVKSEEEVKDKVETKKEKKVSKHKVVAIITPEGIQGNFQSDVKRPLIAHLPIHSSEVQFHDQPFIYDPRPPGPFEAFDASEIDPFAEQSTFEALPKEGIVENTVEVVESIQKEEPKKNTVVSSHSNRKEYGPTSLLVQYSSTKHTQQLPDFTDLACFWCCDTFQGRPCVIPLKIVDGVWNVYGNFCTPQCCMSYLLSETIDTHTRWERIALLNRLYGGSTCGRIYPAPNRECLQRFGGPISLQEFREISESQRIRVDIQLPPMVSILASMDTKPIDFYETSLRNTAANPYVNTRTTEESQSLKLKRSKPLKDKESTLDSCLQIFKK